MNLIKNLLFTLLLVLSLTLANAQTVTITAGSQWEDTYLYDRSGYRDNNYATNPNIHARAWTNSGSPITIRSLMKMDLSAIPAGSTTTFNLYNIHYEVYAITYLYYQRLFIHSASFTGYHRRNLRNQTEVSYKAPDRRA